MRQKKLNSTSGSTRKLPRKVLRAAIREKVMFGLDVCNKAMLDKQGFDAIVECEDAAIAREV